MTTLQTQKQIIHCSSRLSTTVPKWDGFCFDPKVVDPSCKTTREHGKCPRGFT
jgi:hypothetical protein